MCKPKFKKIYNKKIKGFIEKVQDIDLDKANEKRDNLYQHAVDELSKLKNGELNYADIFHNPDSSLRNAIILIHLDFKEFGK